MKTQKSKKKCNKSTDDPLLNYNTQEDKRMRHKKQGNTCVKMKRHFRLSLLFGIAILQLPCKYKSFLFYLCDGKNYSVDVFSSIVCLQLLYFAIHLFMVITILLFVFFFITNLFLILRYIRITAYIFDIIHYLPRQMK